MNFASNFLSPNFTWAEATVTDTRIPNVPNDTQAQAIRTTAVKMEMIRAILGHRGVTINSWFRSHTVNVAVGGSETSSHLIGSAVDFSCNSFGTPLEICEFLAQRQWVELLQIDQLILYKGRVHIGFRSNPRKQFLTKAADGTYPIGFRPEKL